MNSFPKLITLDDFSPRSEPTIQVVKPHEFNSKLAQIKTSSDALDYIKNVKPIPGKTIILVLAMTAGEIYGPNRNGDAWPEKPLRVGSTVIGPEEVLPKHYQSFETSANVFRHHVNKDPEKRIGLIMKAFYNWPMHRVELLISLFNDQADDIVDKIENGEYPAVSMGCKVKKDICSICGNEAPSRNDYCDHAKYQLGELLPNGKRIFVWNPSPKFFDISIVRRPADRLGFMMKKVAEVPYDIQSSWELGEYTEKTSQKIANLRKLSLIQKVVSGDVTASKTDNGNVKQIKNFNDNVAKNVVSSMPPIGDEAIRQMTAHHPAEVLATLSSMGILLTTPEFLKYFVWKFAPDISIPTGYLERAVALQKHVFSALADNPDLLNKIEETGCFDLSPENIHKALFSKLSNWIDKRSQVRDLLVKHAWFGLKRIRPDLATGYAPGDYNLIDVTDPATNKKYQTTETAVRQTEGLAKLHKAKRLLGAGALIAGGAALGPGRGILPLLAGPGIHELRRVIQEYPTTTSDTGEKIYLPSYYNRELVFPGTELVEKSSSCLELNLADAIIKIAMEYSHYPKAQSIKLEPFDLSDCNNDFDIAAMKIGEIICQTSC